MSPNDMGFSDDEQRVLEYFRPSAASKWRHGAIFDLSFIIISLVFGALYLVYRDPGAGFVAYTLVFWRAWDCILAASSVFEGLPQHLQ